MEAAFVLQYGCGSSMLKLSDKSTPNNFEYFSASSSVNPVANLPVAGSYNTSIVIGCLKDSLPFLPCHFLDSIGLTSTFIIKICFIVYKGVGVDSPTPANITTISFLTKSIHHIYQHLQYEHHIVYVHAFHN